MTETIPAPDLVRLREPLSVVAISTADPMTALGSKVLPTGALCRVHVEQMEWLPHDGFWTELSVPALGEQRFRARYGALRAALGPKQAA